MTVKKGNRARHCRVEGGGQAVIVAWVHGVFDIAINRRNVIQQQRGESQRHNQIAAAMMELDGAR